MTINNWSDLASAGAVIGLVGGAVASTVRESVALIRRRKRSDALLRLANIRTRGVELRNDGAYRIATADEFHNWEVLVDAWDEEAARVLDGVAKHEAAIFRTIDRFEVGDVMQDGTYLPDGTIGRVAHDDWHRRRVAMLGSRTRELKRISERYSSSTSI